MTRITYATPERFSGLLPVPTVRPGLQITSGISWHFAEVSELAAHLAALPANGGEWNDDEWNRATREPGSRFNGNITWPDALAALRDGWAAGAESARKLRDGITANMPQAPRMVRYDMAGILPDVRRHLAGNPQSMRRLAPAYTATRPVLTLAADISNSVSVSADSMIACAAATAATVDILEDAGFPCHLLTLDRGMHGEFSSEIAATVKDAGAPLSLPVAAFALGHPAMLRRIGFALLAGDARAKRIGFGMGAPLRTPHDHALRFYAIPAAQTLEKTGATNAPRMFAAICSALRAQGCPGIPDAEALAHLAR